MDLTQTARRLAPVLVATGLLSLGGCSWFHHQPETAKADPVPPTCPTVAIVPQLAQASKFDGDGSGYSALSYTASLSGLTSHCTFQDSGIAIDATFKLMAQQGPKGQGGTVDFPYFVAVLDPAGTVLQKSLFPAPLTLTAQQARIGSKESFHDFIPLADQSAAGAYAVVIGFQLDPRQVQFNRSTGVGG
jgi:hypothetical protein